MLTALLNLQNIGDPIVPASRSFVLSAVSRTFVVNQDISMIKLPAKLAPEVLAYTFDFSGRLPSGALITSAQATLVSGDVDLEAYATSFTSTTVTFWLSAGTPLTTSQVTISATTSGGETLAEDASIFIAS